MKLVKRGDRYETISEYEERHIPKAAGFRWDPTNKAWWTNDIAKAVQLADYASVTLKDELAEFVKERERAFEASSATDAEIDLPIPEGLEYLPFQKAGIAYGIQQPNILLADEMGLGKTIQAIGIINADPTIERALLIVPATLRTFQSTHPHGVRQRPLRRWTSMCSFNPRTRMGCDL